MSWYRRIKKAMPLAQVTCPTCHSALLVDVKQPTTTNRSEPYEAKETGDCVTSCVKCRQFMLVSYNFDLTQAYFATGSTKPITEEEAKEAIKTLLYVTSTND